MIASLLGHVKNQENCPIKDRQVVDISVLLVFERFSRVEKANVFLRLLDRESYFWDTLH